MKPVSIELHMLLCFLLLTSDCHANLKFLRGDIACILKKLSSYSNHEALAQQYYYNQYYYRKYSKGCDSDCLDLFESIIYVP